MDIKIDDNELNEGLHRRLEMIANILSWYTNKITSPSIST